MISQDNTTARELTTKASRRIWQEPGVRNWWVIAIVVTIVVILLLVEQIWISRTGRYRLEHWTYIKDAKIEKLKDSNRATLRVSPGELPDTPAVIVYTDKAGVTHTVEGRLEGQKEAASPGKIIPILVDPTNYNHFDDRVEFGGWITILIAPIVLCPLPIILITVALYRRSQYVKLWRNGIEVAGEVVGIKNSAVAPKSYFAKCIVERLRNTNVVSVTVPRSLGKISLRDRLRLIISPTDSKIAIVLELYS